MAEAISVVTGRIAPERIADLEAAYAEVVSGGLPPTLEDSFLLRTDQDQVAILSIWHRRSDLERLAASGEEGRPTRMNGWPWRSRAIGPGSVAGRGTSPEQALGSLAEHLRRMPGNPSGLW